MLFLFEFLEVFVKAITKKKVNTKAHTPQQFIKVKKKTYLSRPVTLQSCVLFTIMNVNVKSSDFFPIINTSN